MALSVIIPSRTLKNLDRCAEAVQRLDPGLDVIAVWDRSRGNHWIAPTSAYRVREVESDFVYARNCNIGIQSAGENDVILLNDDALLKTPMGFTRMAEEAHKYPDIGLVSAACNNVGNVNQHPRGIGMRTDDRMVCFVAVLIKRSTINLIGGLDEAFVGYGCEDDSYCLETRLAGLKIGIYDHCFVDHSELTSTFRGGPESAGDFRPNLKIFIEKYKYDNRGLPKELSPWKELFPA